MVKKIAIVYIIIALIIAIVSTIMQTQPSLWVIDNMTSFDGKYFVKLTVLLTFGILLLPLLVILILVKLLEKGPKNVMPDSFQFKTGIIVQREKQLQDAFYTMKVLVNGEKVSGVTNGKKTFVELDSGSYKVFVKGGVTVSPVVDVVLNKGEIIELKASYTEQTKFKSSLSLLRIEKETI